MGNWPQDADGDVFRSLEADGCDFSKTYEIDFFVDFEDWPPSEEALAAMTAQYDELLLQDEEEEEVPCVVIKLEAKLTYEFVTETQKKLSDIVKPYGGICMDWGVQV